MSEQQDKMLQSYLERVMTIKEQQSKTLTEQELRSIAREVGLSDADLAAADQAAHQHYQRGLNFFQHRRWDDAIHELHEAVAFAPGWLDYKAQLAMAHLERWQQSGRESDRYAAASLARECIDIDPNFDQAYQILNRVDQPQPTPQQARPQQSYAAPGAYASSSKKKSSGAGVLIGIIAASFGLLTCAGAGMAFFLVGTDAPSDYSVREIPPPRIDPINTPSVKSLIPKAPSTYKPSSRKGNPIPVNIDLGKYKDVEVVNKSFSELRVYTTTNTAYYEGNIKLKNNFKNREITRFNWRIQYVGSTGEVVLTDTKSYMGAFSPKSYRPGDVMNLRVFKKVPTDVTAVNILLEGLKTSKAKSSYKPSKELKLNGADGVDISGIAISQREAPFKTYRSNKTHGYLVPVVIVTNKKADTIKYMKTQFIMLDKGGNVLDRQDWSLISSTSGGLASGESNMLQRTFKVPRAFDSYRIEIVQVRMK